MLELGFIVVILVIPAEEIEENTMLTLVSELCCRGAETNTSDPIGVETLYETLVKVAEGVRVGVLVGVGVAGILF